MNVLFITIAYPKAGGNNIYSDLMQEFKHNGHQVYVACSNEKRNGQKTAINIEDGKNILRIRVGNLTGSVNVINKGLSTVLLESTFIKAIKDYYQNVNFNLIIYSTPPITLIRVVKYIKKRDNAKAYLLLKDIFPQNAVDIGLLKRNGLIHKYFRYKEKKLYKLFDYIGCMSKANIDYVLCNNPELQSDIVEICPNSIKPITIDKNKDTIKKIKEKYKISPNKTIFIYGGNLGKPQGIDFLIECLRANKANPQVYFVIAGSGSEFNRIKAFIDTEKPINVQLFNQMPKSDYEMLMNSCDVGMIFLDNRFTIPNFPSRLLSYMNASMPVLAATDINTDLRQIIESGGFGAWCKSGDIERFNYNLQQLCNGELRKQMGESARKYLEDNYTVNLSYKIIMNHFK